MMVKLFCVFGSLAMVLLLIIELFSLRGTTSPIGYLVVLGFILSAICSAIALTTHICCNK
jgi:hypothetical protein